MCGCKRARMLGALATLHVLLVTVEGFRVPSVGNVQRSSGRWRTSLNVATMPAEVITLPKAPPKTRSKRLHVQIEDSVYDLTGWRSKHPAGAHWIDHYDQQDATDIIYAFHSDEGLEMFRRMPKAKGAQPLEADETTKNFRSFRKQLVADGWFKREWHHEAFLLVALLSNFAAGIALGKAGHAVAATAVLSIAHTTCGWLAHDYIHGRGKWCSFMRLFGALSIGLGVKWWSEKHNTHHAFTNQVGVDEDIMVEPALFLWSPTEERDKPWRKLQHYLWPIPFSALFAMWRFDSIRDVLKGRRWKEMAALAVHYTLLFNLVSLPIAIGHIMLGGLLSATIVTVTHTAEEMMPEYNPSFVDSQFRTTRDADTRDPFSEYVWGGMQYQLEHHLFPTMPRYKYRRLVPLLKEWAETNGLKYRVTGSWQIIRDNISQLRKVAEMPTQVDSPDPKGVALA